MEDTKKDVVEMKKPEINYRGLKGMPFIIGNETFEKLGAMGTLANLLVYLTTVFNMKTISAVTLLTVFSGTSNLATLLGAYLCDTYFGRYNTLAFSSITSFLGLLMINLTAVFKKLHPPHCGSSQEVCETATSFQMSFLLMGFGLMIIGAAGIRPCNFAFGADQFNPNTESGKKGINSFFNWYFFTFTFAQLVSLTLIVYVQSNVSWSIGLAIPAGLMLIGCLLFFMGSNVYVKIQPQGSPIVGLVQVIAAAFRKRGLKLQDDGFESVLMYIPPDSINSTLPHTSQFSSNKFNSVPICPKEHGLDRWELNLSSYHEHDGEFSRFLDKAAIITPLDHINPDGSAANPWRLSTQQQVEEVKCIMRVIPIWASAIIYHVPIVLMHTYVVFQALQSDRQFGSTCFKIPASSYIVFLMISYTLWIPLYDRLFVPLLEKLRKKDGGITILQRIGIGMGLSILTMLIAGIVENNRRRIAITKPTLGVFPRKGEISSMSGLWLVFPLSLAGLAEAFTAIGQVEFYYKQFPENMRSVAGSLFFCGMAMSSYLSSLLIWIVHRVTEKGNSSDWLAEDLNKGRLDYLYYMVAGLGCVNLVYFLGCARWYKYKGSCECTNKIDVQSLGCLELTDTEKITV